MIWMSFLLGYEFLVSYIFPIRYIWRYLKHIFTTNTLFRWNVKMMTPFIWEWVLVWEKFSFVKVSGIIRILWGVKILLANCTLDSTSETASYIIWYENEFLVWEQFSCVKASDIMRCAVLMWDLFGIKWRSFLVINIPDTCTYIHGSKCMIWYIYTIIYYPFNIQASHKSQYCPGPSVTGPRRKRSQYWPWICTLGNTAMASHLGRRPRAILQYWPRAIM